MNAIKTALAIAITAAVAYSAGAVQVGAAQDGARRVPVGNPEIHLNPDAMFSIYCRGGASVYYGDDGGSNLWGRCVPADEAENDLLHDD